MCRSMVIIVKFVGVPRPNCGPGYRVDGLKSYCLNAPWITINLGLISRVLEKKKVDSGMLHVLHTFREKRIFIGPYLAIFSDF